MNWSSPLIQSQHIQKASFTLSSNLAVYSSAFTHERGGMVNNNNNKSSSYHGWIAHRVPGTNSGLNLLALSTLMLKPSPLTPPKNPPSPSWNHQAPLFTCLLPN